jgi:SAM-dependent methyltransferase
MPNETGAGSGQVVVTEEVMKTNFVRRVQPPVNSAHQPGPEARHNSSFSAASSTTLESGTAGSKLWSAYWQEFCLENVPHERCYIPGDGRFAVDRHWAHFADALPRGAQVLDLGCGAGIVGRILLSRRNDLRVTGIDFAKVPTPAVDNLTILPQVSMEAIPFEDGCFDAAISLFGIEYGNIQKTAGELGRLLKPGARFSFLVHHLESEIVREGSTRRKGLRELLSGKVKASFLAGNIPGVDQQTKRLGYQFPNEPSVRQFSIYLRHHVTRARADRQAAWENLLGGLNPEIALLTQLEKSAKSATKMCSWLVSLLPIMRIVSVSVLRRNSGKPIAWQVNGVR